jgi:spore coat polysaccharide biosynthesis protein SpsF
MGSTRLPGKVLLDLAGEPLLWHVVRRVQRIASLDGFLVATSTERADDRIEGLCLRHRWPCFRGDEKDVLDRYYQAARHVQTRHVVRVTADCPLLCPHQTGLLLEHHLHAGADYTHNVTVWGSGMPLGTGGEVITFEALEMSWREGREPHHREHVSEYIYEHPERFRIEKVPAPPELRRPELRLTVDTPEDLELIRAIYDRLYCAGETIRLLDAIALLDAEPRLREINRHVGQR